MGATVETIEINQDNDVPHNYGAVSRWIVMYPYLPLVILYMCGEMLPCDKYTVLYPGPEGRPVCPHFLSAFKEEAPLVDCH